MEYQSLKELYTSLKGAFNVKLRLIKKEYPYIKNIDIWNYLKINKWSHDKNLTISEMVNDIIESDIKKIDIFIKEKTSKDVMQWKQF